MAKPIGSTPVSLEQDIILIREARFGRNVREAIHHQGGYNLCYVFWF